MGIVRGGDCLEVMKGMEGGRGYISFKTSKRPAVVVWSFGGGWEHVSVSFASRCPTWDEMCEVKDIFWTPEECVVQYHPPAKTGDVNYIKVFLKQ